jgi:hypothetical protein
VKNRDWDFVFIKARFNGLPLASGAIYDAASMTPHLYHCGYTASNRRYAADFFCLFHFSLPYGIFHIHNRFLPHRVFIDYDKMAEPRQKDNSGIRLTSTATDTLTDGFLI